MVSGLFVLNRVYNLTRVCPKQGLNLSLTGCGSSLLMVPLSLDGVLKYGVLS